MGTNNEQFQEEMEIDIFEIFQALKQRILLIIFATFLGASIAYLATSWLVQPKYESSTKIYVLNTQDTSQTTVTYSDLQSSTQLTKDYMELVKTAPVLEAAIAELKLDNLTWDGLLKKIDVATQKDGRIISITATDTSPIMAKKIADSVQRNVAHRIMEVMNVQAVNVVAEGKIPTRKSSPSMKKNIMLGAFAFMAIAVGIIILMVLLDDKVKSTDDIAREFGISTLGVIPLESKADKKKMKKSMKRKNSRG